MKKVFVLMTVLAGMALLTSCDDMLNGLVGNFTGNAWAIIGADDGENTAVKQEYTASVVVFDTAADPQYAVSLSMVMGIEDLLNISSADQLQFPFLLYRVVGNDIVSGSTFQVENTLTEEDLKNFDYHSLISGDYSKNQIVAIAVSPTLFYVMHKGEINITAVGDKKSRALFRGTHT